MWGTSKLQTEGTRTEGTVLDVGPANDPAEHHLRIGITFDDGATVEFEQDFPDHFDLSIPDVRGLPLANGVYAPAPTSVPVSFTAGQRIPVRYDAKHRQKAVVDWSAVQLRVVPAWKECTPEGQEWCRRYQPDRASSADPVTVGADLPVPMGATSIDVNNLAQLAELHRQGDLSDEEFDAAKRKALGI